MPNLLEDTYIPIRYTVAAQVIEPADTDYEELKTIAKGFFVASDSPFENGKPKMLFINAWIVHEGRNLNGDAFVGEEIKARVNQGLFSPPYAGMIDLDHDFTARGFWYKANYAFDEKAQKWGVLAAGAVWAWRYTELADFMLQEMANDGFINVSMSAIAEVIEPTFTYPGFEGEKTYIRHNPIFFTSAILTVPPGDPDAIGQVSLTAAAEPKEPTTVQTLIFPKTHWKSAEAASRWAKTAGFKINDYRTTPASFRYRQIDPGKFDPNSFRTICLSGAKRDEPANPKCAVKAVIGKLKGGN